MKRKFCHLGDSHQNSQMKRQCFSSSRPKLVPYLISSPRVKHGVFLSYLTSSQSSGSNDCVDEDEYVPSSTYASTLHIWIDRACVYAYRQEFQDDRDCVFSFQQDFLPPTHLHEFYFMIDYMFIYAHDYYVLELSLLFHVGMELIRPGSFLGYQQKVPRQSRALIFSSSLKGRSLTRSETKMRKIGKGKNNTWTNVISLKCTTQVYLASGQLMPLPSQSHVE